MIKIATARRSMAYHVSGLVVFILYNKYHVKTREDGGHEVYVLFSLCLVPATIHTVGRG